MVFRTALPAPDVVITSSGDATAGQPYTLTCTATVIENLVVPPTVEWLIGRQSVSNGDGIIVEPTEVSEVNSSRVLRISTLRSSHGGQYTCRARINIPSIGISELDGMEQMDVNVPSKSCDNIVSELVVYCIANMNIRKCKMHEFVMR